MKTSMNEARALATTAAFALTLGLGCDPDAMQRTVDETPDVEQVDHQRLTDTLQRENARIDMAAREALAYADRAEQAGQAEQDAPGDLSSERDAFMTASRERLRQLQLEMERIHARTDRRIGELDATLDQDRHRAAEQLERLIDVTQDGYVRARDAVTREIDELEARMRRFRERIDDAA